MSEHKGAVKKTHEAVRGEKPGGGTGIKKGEKRPLCLSVVRGNDRHSQGEEGCRKKESE